MKKIFITFLFIFIISSHSLAFANCEQKKGCEKKACNIEKQIKIAKDMNNGSKENGLKKALSEVLEHCTDDKLKHDIEDKITDAQNDIKDYKKDREEATAEGKKDKISKYNKKISEEEAVIHSLRLELEDLK